jgi:hypothetical protein
MVSVPPKNVKQKKVIKVEYFRKSLNNILFLKEFKIVKPTDLDFMN